MERKNQDISTSKIKPTFPTDGIIGSNPPGWLDLGSLHRRPSGNSDFKLIDPRRRKLDLEDAFDNCNSAFCPQHSQNFLENTRPDWNDGRRTLQMYPGNADSGSQLPDRFDNPAWFKGYGCEKRQHPFYATTSSQYGQFPPNVHTMPAKYTPMKNVFSEYLTSRRNRSLNIRK